MSIKLSNIHKPTSAFWSKVSMAATNASLAIAGYGLAANIKGLMIFGGICAAIGAIIPPFISDNTKDESNKLNN